MGAERHDSDADDYLSDVADVLFEQGAAPDVNDGFGESVLYFCLRTGGE